MTISAASSLGGGGLAPVFFLSQGFGGSGFFFFSSFGASPFASLLSFAVGCFVRDGALLPVLRKKEKIMNKLMILLDRNQNLSH